MWLMPVYFYIQQQRRPLRVVFNFEEFKQGYGKSSYLTILNNVPIRFGVSSVDLILDPICLGRYNFGGLGNINLRLVQGYYCCEHVLYCPFSCTDKNFFVRATSLNRRTGIPLDAEICPFIDGGLPLIAQANYVPLNF
jgi:hypothetical protein